MTSHIGGQGFDECSEATKNVTVVMPLAGKGLRAQALTHDRIPKSLLRLGNGQTILEAMCRQLQAVGFRRFVFCVGHLKDPLIRHIREESWITDLETKYVFDETDRLLGPSGTVLHAIESLSLSGHALAVPGDLMLPWTILPAMISRHVGSHADVTFGVTSFVSARTADVGKIVVEDRTTRLLRVYGRNDMTTPPIPGTRNLTAAAVNVLTVGRFAELCADFVRSHPMAGAQPLSLRDDILPWVIGNPIYKIQAYDLGGEILDLGSPESIKYAQSNWRRYLLDD